jgi:hypothetical protein
MMKPRAAKYCSSLQTQQVFRIVREDWRSRVTAVLFALSCSSHANETAGAMMASPFSLARRGAAEMLVIGMRSWAFGMFLGPRMVWG